MPNNKHGEKIVAMRERGLLPEGFDEGKGDTLPDSRAYSDSSADVPLLTVCEHGTMVHPSERFSAIGEERGWKTIIPERPYSGKWGWGARLASVRQALGMWPI